MSRVAEVETAYHSRWCGLARLQYVGGLETEAARRRVGPGTAAMVVQGVTTAADVSRVPGMRRHAACASVYLLLGAACMLVSPIVVMAPAIQHGNAVAAWMFLPSGLCGFLLFALGVLALVGVYRLQLRYQRTAYARLVDVFTAGTLADLLAAENLVATVVFDEDDAAHRLLWESCPGSDIPGPLVLLKTIQLVRGGYTASRLAAKGKTAGELAVGDSPAAAAACQRASGVAECARE